MPRCQREAIITTKDDHRLPDLLRRNRRGELDMTVVMVISAIATRPMLGNWHIGTIPATLDDGPIIEQDVVRVDHRHGLSDLIRLGADVERAVLSRAVL